MAFASALVILPLGLAPLHAPVIQRLAASRPRFQERSPIGGYTATVAPPAPVDVDYAALAKEWVLNDGFHAPAKPSLMSDDFVWFGPLVGPLNKQDFIGTVSSFAVYEGFPDLKILLSEFTQDPVEKDRYWGILRLEGTHTQPLASGTGAPPYKVTNKPLDVGPQAVSVTFDADGRVSRYTGGYIVDRRQGATDMNGGIFAFFKTVGGFLPGRRVAKLLNALGALLKNFPKNRSRKEDLPPKWAPLGRQFGLRTADAWDSDALAADALSDALLR